MKEKKTKKKVGEDKGHFLDRIQKTLKEKYACYVLITCSEPSATGHMDVELHFSGDETLASFLIENAGQRFIAQEEHRELKS